MLLCPTSEHLIHLVFIVHGSSVEHSKFAPTKNICSNIICEKAHNSSTIHPCGRIQGRQEPSYPHHHRREEQDPHLHRREERDPHPHPHQHQCRLWHRHRHRHRQASTAGDSRTLRRRIQEKEAQKKRHRSVAL